MAHLVHASCVWCTTRGALRWCATNNKYQSRATRGAPWCATGNQKWCATGSLFSTSERGFPHKWRPPFFLVAVVLGHGGYSVAWLHGLLPIDSAWKQWRWECPARRGGPTSGVDRSGSVLGHLDPKRVMGMWLFLQMMHGCGGCLAPRWDGCGCCGSRRCGLAVCFDEFLVVVSRLLRPNSSGQWAYREWGWERPVVGWW